MSPPTGARRTARQLVTRLGLWRLTRHPAVRRLYDRLDDRGLLLARLDRFERPVAAGTTEDLPGPPADVTMTVARAVDGLPPRLRGDPLAPGDRVVLARRDGDVVGYCCLSDRRIFVPELHRRLRPPGAYCWRVFVDPSARGEGVGTALVAEATRRAWTDFRADTVSALVAPDNLPSRRLFRSLGFSAATRHTGIGLGGLRWHGESELHTGT